MVFGSSGSTCICGTPFPRWNGGSLRRGKQEDAHLWLARPTGLPKRASQKQGPSFVEVGLLLW